MCDNLEWMNDKLRDMTFEEKDKLSKKESLDCPIKQFQGEIKTHCDKTWTEGEVIGRGQYGQVYKTCYKDNAVCCDYVLKQQDYDEDVYNNEIKASN